MSNLILPNDVSANEKEDTTEVSDQIEITYKPTVQDEECFFLMHHMHIQPSEAYALKDDHRRWLIARFIGQKQMEREMIEQHKIAQGLMNNGGLGGLRVQK